MTQAHHEGMRARGDTVFRLAVIGAVVAVSIGVFALRFGYAIELPAMPPEPAGALEQARAVSDEIARSDRAYRERLRRDAQRLRAPTEPEELERAFRFERDEPGVTLRTRQLDTIEAAGLRLHLEVEPIPGSHRQQMVLVIENLTEHHLAYRISTRPTAGTRTCRHKRAIPHDAIAIAPGHRERRSECTYERGWGLEILGVEVIELPKLGYYYVSQLRPRDIGLSSRTSGAHRPAAGAPCDLIVSTRVTRALESGELSWRDAVDFYARHDCRQFTIPSDYRAFDRDHARRLPVSGRGR